MGVILRIVIFLCSTSFGVAVIYLLIKRKISERNSLMWLFFVFSSIIIAAFPEILDYVAKAVGISYPPALIFLFSTVVLLLMNLYNSAQISVLNMRIGELTQNIAIREAIDGQKDSFIKKNTSYKEKLEVIESEEYPVGY